MVYYKKIIENVCGKIVAKKGQVFLSQVLLSGSLNLIHFPEA